MAAHSALAARLLPAQRQHLLAVRKRQRMLPDNFLLDTRAPPVTGAAASCRNSGSTRTTPRRALATRAPSSRRCHNSIMCALSELARTVGVSASIDQMLLE